ncbi:MAG: hypothetical protein KF775_17765 [Cyclobacteriaceae bacterium]|nr:hypothetical protein [Cyclobacteriaceae bacterium]
MNAVKTIVILLVSLNSVCAQLEQLDRYELILPDNESAERNQFKVASLEDDGLLIYRVVSEATGDDKLQLIRLDTAMKEKWQGFVALDKSLQISHIRTYKDIVFLLFKSARAVSGNFQVMAADIKSGSFVVHTIENFIPFNPTDFVATNRGLMLGGYFNYRPLVLFYNFSTQRARVLPGFFNEPGELNQIKINTDETVDIVVSAKNFERKKCLWIRNYDAEGNLNKTTVLEPDQNKHLIFGRSTHMGNRAQVVAGIYGNRNSEYSRGIFLAEINEAGEYAIQYYNFGDLQNFFSYMKANRERRTKERIERRKIKGKKIKFNYRLLVQEVVPYGNQYIMLGEAFYPTYTYLTSRPGYSYNPAYFTSMYRSDRVFNGYQYTHAVVIGFDTRGKLVWDNSFEINDAKSFELQQFVKIAPDDDHISLLYLHNNLIRTKIIKGNQVLEGKSADPLKTRFDFDLIKERDTESSKLDYWYSNHFFASGVQRVRNQAREAATRKVFFINKLKYQ